MKTFIYSSLLLVSFFVLQTACEKKTPNNTEKPEDTTHVNPVDTTNTDTTQTSFVFPDDLAGTKWTIISYEDTVNYVRESYRTGEVNTYYGNIKRTMKNKLMTLDRVLIQNTEVHNTHSDYSIWDTTYNTDICTMKSTLEFTDLVVDADDPYDIYPPFHYSCFLFIKVVSLDSSLYCSQSHSLFWNLVEKEDKNYLYISFSGRPAPVQHDSGNNFTPCAGASSDLALFWDEYEINYENEQLVLTTTTSGCLDVHTFDNSEYTLISTYVFERIE